MKLSSARCFYEPATRSLKLTLQYRIPSLNKTSRQHWHLYRKERRLAANALMLALSHFVLDPSTTTTWQEAASLSLIHFATAKLYQATPPAAITLDITQVKVPNFRHERTEI